VKFVFGAGGTGGHIIPAISLADELKHRGHECYFVGNANSMEESLCTSSEYKFYPMKVQKLYRNLKPENLLFPYYLITSIYKALKVVRTVSPDAVICTGGFVSGPVAIAAVLSKTPLFFHESNSFPGLVTRFMTKYINTIYISFESTRKYLPMAKLINLGIPLKQKPVDNFKLEELGLTESKPTILVSGGSQGSLAINKVVEQALPAILEKGYQLIWQTGKATYSKFAQNQNQAGVYLFDFSSRLPSMLAEADIAITRAGAMSIAEQKETRTPAILIPLPTAAENHQYYNALEQDNLGLAKMLEQNKLTQQSLLQAIDAIATHLSEYKQRLNMLPVNNASASIVDDILFRLATTNAKTKGV